MPLNLNKSQDTFVRYLSIYIFIYWIQNINLISISPFTHICLCAVLSFSLLVCNREISILKERKIIIKSNGIKKGEKKLNFEKIKIKTTTLDDHKKIYIHTYMFKINFILYNTLISFSRNSLLISNSMNANRDLPQYYYITFLPSSSSSS